MSASLPPEIEIEDRGTEGIAFRLPRRNLGGMRWVGVVAVLCGLTVGAGVAFTIISIISGVQPGWHRHIFGYLIFFALPTLGGLLPLWWGLSLIFGRCEFHLTDRYLRKRECLGPFSWSRRLPADAITTFSITSIFNVNQPKNIPGWLHHFDCLKCSIGLLHQKRLTWGYPALLLEPLAVAIAEHCDRKTATSPMPDGSPRKPIGVYSDYSGTLKVRLTEEEMRNDYEEDDDEGDDPSEDDISTDEVEVADEVAKPAFTLVEVETFPEGVTIKVPAAGLWQGTSGLFVFSLVWNGAMLGFSGLCLAALVGGKANDDDSLWILPGFLSLFWAVGIAVLCAAVNMGLRKAAIAVAGDTLMVIQTGPFGVKRKEWPLAEVSEISVGPSGMKVNDIDVLELQIHSESGPKVGMLAGRNNAELYWLAKLLSNACTATTGNSEVPAETGDLD